jgi:hypothetical protein
MGSASLRGWHSFLADWPWSFKLAQRDFSLPPRDVYRTPPRIIFECAPKPHSSAQNKRPRRGYRHGLSSSLTYASSLKGIHWGDSRDATNLMPSTIRSSQANRVPSH